MVARIFESQAETRSLCHAVTAFDLGEHLVMAAHVFPLVVKLQLEQEGHYALTAEDRAACLATDLRLTKTQWIVDDDGREEGHSWHEVIQKTKRGVKFDAIGNGTRPNILSCSSRTRIRPGTGPEWNSVMKCPSALLPASSGARH